MQLGAFNAYMSASDFADAARKSRIYALERIENVEGVDLRTEVPCDEFST